MSENETISETNKLVLKHFTTIGQQQKKPAVLNAAK